MKRSWKMLAVILCLCGLLTVAYAAAAGGADDPLITLSYLTDVFTGQVEEMVDKAVADNRSELEQALQEAVTAANGGSDAASFAQITLAQGQTLVGEAGCELVLCSGAAAWSVGEGDLPIDGTDGVTLESGFALAANHLYLFPTSVRCAPSGEEVQLLIRGGYTVEGLETPETAETSAD